MGQEVIKIKNLTKTFKNHNALRDVNLSVNKGDIVGLIGENGSGKTTLLKIMAHLLSASGGDVDMFGNSLNSSYDRCLADILFISDAIGFYPMLSGIQNLKLGVSLYGDFGKAQLVEAMEFAGLSEAYKNKAATYSLGMKQRINIAKLYLIKPRILLMDEPFNGIDQSGVTKLIDSIVSLNGQNKMSVIISSHQLGELERFCGRVVELRQGEIKSDYNLKSADHVYVEIRLNDSRMESVISKRYQFERMESGIIEIKLEECKINVLNEFLFENKIKYSYFNVKKGAKVKMSGGGTR